MKSDEDHTIRGHLIFNISNANIAAVRICEEEVTLTPLNIGSRNLCVELRKVFKFR
jgi:hypothetical protein